MLQRMLNRKPFEMVAEDAGEKEGGLKRSLGAFDLTVLGIGAVIGAGIFVIAGKGAQEAGPAIMLSFILVGIACLCAALCYAELASMIPTAGSAYAYTYTTMGEFPAWMIGWFLVLEYTVAAAAVASGWSGYLAKILKEGFHVQLPHAIVTSPLEKVDPGLVNLPAALIAVAVTVLLVLGVRESARVNAALVALKIGVLIIFIAISIPHVNAANWTPFMPFGFGGVITGGALIFFAYIGFDAVATAAEETRDPQKNVPLGIMASLLICTIFYIIVAAVMTGMVPYTQLNVPAPLAEALSRVGLAGWSAVISFGAIFGLSSVVMVLMMGMPRIWFAMARDGLLPKVFAAIHPRFRTPWLATIINGVAVAVITGFLRLDEIAELTNIGTLTAFIVVAVGVWMLRARHPEMHRGFKTPALPAVAIITVVTCGGMLADLLIKKPFTASMFLVWVVLGVAVYFAYGIKHSNLHRGDSLPPGGQA